MRKIGIGGWFGWFRFGGKARFGVRWGFNQHLILVSPEAQEIFANSNNKYPVVEEVATNAAVAGFGDFKADPINAEVFGENNPEALRVTDRTGWK